MKCAAIATLVIALWSGCAEAVPLDQWQIAVEAQLPVLMCANPPFNLCFNEGRLKCEEVARSKVRECIKRVGVPRDFPQSKGGHWGGRVGECVGIETEKVLTKKDPKPQACI